MTIGTDRTGSEPRQILASLNYKILNQVESPITLSQ